MKALSKRERIAQARETAKAIKALPVPLMHKAWRAKYAWAADLVSQTISPNTQSGKCVYPNAGMRQLSASARLFRSAAGASAAEVTAPAAIDAIMDAMHAAVNVYREIK